MDPLLYTELVPWYRLVDPPEDHRDEAATYQAAFERVVPHAETLLELGSGAGHNALHLKRRFRCTLTDPSEPMLALSRELNPDCEHLLGDMRSLRLDRTFDVVFVHDAVCYMTTEEDLLAAARTAYEHTVPGGAAIFAPDALRESFREETEVLEGDDPDRDRSLRCLMWTWDPDPTDGTYAVDFAFLLREGDRVRAVHDHHVEGLFAKDDWRRILSLAGYQVDIIERPVDNDCTDEIFLCRRGA